MRKLLAISLIGLLVLLVPSGRTLARSSGNDKTTAMDKIKIKIAKLGVGEKARAQIKLRNGQRVKGYVTSTSQENFTFTERDSGRLTTIAYSDVIEVKKPGLSKVAKIGIGAGIGVVVLALIANHVRNHLFDGLTLGNQR
jgi:hypothetical protein